MPNISQSKGNRTMKFGQLIKYNKRNVFLQKSWWKWGRETSSRPVFVFSKKTLYELKLSGLQFSFNIVFNFAYIKNKLYKVLDYWSKDTLNFDFIEKGLWIASPPHFVYDFSRKIFLKLYSINWPNFIAWLALLLEILMNMYIAIVNQVLTS